MVPDDELLADRERAKALVDEILSEGGATEAIPVDLLAQTKVLFRESDRGAVLISAVRLDEELERHLKAIFSKGSGTAEKATRSLIDSPTAPLGSLWSKTQLAFVLGLINEEAYEAVQYVRKLRNKFAHSKGEAKLGEEEIKPLLARLERHKRMAAKAIGLELSVEGSDLVEFLPESLLPDSLRAERLTFVVAIMFLLEGIRPTKGQPGKG